MKKKRIWFLILYIFFQCTWGLIQTFIGFTIFLANIRRPHKFYRGCIETQWRAKWSGMSLGLFIFTPSIENNKVRVHEYGHTFQSLYFGPFYLILGIISFMWGNLPVYEKRRREQQVPYTKCFVEAQASRMGERATGERAIW